MRSFSTLTGVALTCGMLFASSVAYGQAPADTRPTPDALKWNLDRLSRDPFQLVKVTADPEKGQVRFVVEFKRTATRSELLDWELDGIIVFRFLDEDGIVIKTVWAKLDGEMAGVKGSRIRLILTLPSEKTLRMTRYVSAG